jgi:DNA helicase II / ATP-dependent DNA helicase PcrA
VCARGRGSRLERVFEARPAPGRPNPAQAEAISHVGGPLLIVAGAGTGKTSTLAARVADLIRRGVVPHRILLLTVTRRAAAEMIARVARSTTPGVATGVWSGTFHSVALRLLRIYGGAVGLGPNFTVVDPADAAELMNLVRNDLDLGRSGRRFPTKDTLAGIFSLVVNSRTKLGRVLEDSFPWCASDLDDIARVFEGYMCRKREQDVVDFDDLLLLWNAIAGAPGVGATVAGLFDHILVDEYQDTNIVQRDILMSMRKGRDGLTVVGDDAQAIYGFRAATVDNILDFDDQFPGARTIVLEDNYRSTQAILDVSNAIARATPRRHPKDLRATGDDGPRPVLATCFDEAHQSTAVCLHVLEGREAGMPLQRQAVLFRAAHHSTALELELNRRNIPFVKFGGLRFVETSHVKDLLALMRVLENPHDELAWFRSLQLVDGVGPGSATRLMSQLGVRGEARGAPSSPLLKFIASASPVGRAVPGQLEALRAGLRDCALAQDAPAARIDRLLVFLGPALDRMYDDARSRLADLEQLARMAGATRRPPGSSRNFPWTRRSRPGTSPGFRPWTTITSS